METDEVVQEILSMHKLLPPRPEVAEVKAAIKVVEKYADENEEKVKAIESQKKGTNVKDELFEILVEMQSEYVYYQSNEKKREALRVCDLEDLHLTVDRFIKYASHRMSGVSGENGSSSGNVEVKEASSSRTPFGGSNEIEECFDERPMRPDLLSESSKLRSRYRRAMPLRVGSSSMSQDDSFLNKKMGEFSGGDDFDSYRQKQSSAEGQEGKKMDMLMLASTVVISAKKGVTELDLQGKLDPEVECLHDSVYKLLGLITLNASHNHLLTLPETLGAISTLQKLDLSSNKIYKLPDSISCLINLVHLDLSFNKLASVRNDLEDLVNLQVLNLSSNELQWLPFTISSLTKLKILDVEHNCLTEIPYTISNCSSLREIRASSNKIESLPDSIVLNGALEVLLLRYNNIKTLPESMGASMRMRELDVSFNKLESVPDSLCSATTYVKINISNNFVSLMALPPSIGELTNLEELYMSNNQIAELPESFKKLSKLRVLDAEQNPLTYPPKYVIDQGAEAVVQYIIAHPPPRVSRLRKYLSNMCCVAQLDDVR